MANHTRPSIDEYYCNIVREVARRSTCLDRQVGCVMVDCYNNILSTGYNGAPRGATHCIDLGYCIKDKTGNPDNCPATHSEINALIQCRDAYKIKKVYLTRSPCVACTRMLLNTTCQEIHFLSDHGQEGKHPEAEKLWKKVRKDGLWKLHI